MRAYCDLSATGVRYYRYNFVADEVDETKPTTYKRSVKVGTERLTYLNIEYRLAGTSDCRTINGKIRRLYCL